MSMATFGFIALLLGGVLTFGSRSPDDVLPSLARSAAQAAGLRRISTWASVRYSLVRALERAPKRRSGG